MKSVKEVVNEIMSIPSFNKPSKELFEDEKNNLKNFKKAFLLIAGTCFDKLGSKLAEEQELMMNISEMIIEIYLLESALLKTEKLITLNPKKHSPTLP